MFYDKCSPQRVRVLFNRNPLKPLEVPRTPGLPFMDEDMKDFSGLRGQRL